ncbi:helix-turn-helix domain-containing protein [Xylanimonas ulmi]|uniref:AraC-like DNA-binding protein n=1 Tax=Xylanimonas ulmi TaxID=228973 RepID=A0A4Q7M1S0_9MICO|nr:AraC family transcriptional regulator [Xylanibacterium ulmi]RZS60338.1 AraC-like DNA-binding protein [Xylanibacterium ulmi]
MRSHVPGPRARLRAVRADGTPVYRFDGPPGVPPVWVTRFDGAHAEGVLPADQRHAHDFHVLVYAEDGGGEVRLDGATEPLRAGELVTVPPGRVIGAGEPQPPDSRAWAVSFTPDAVPALAGLPPLAWAGHPLLAAFDGVRRVPAPAERRAAWVGWLAELREETAHPDRVGAGDATRALLTRMLVELARAVGQDGETPTTDPLVRRVLAVVEARFAEPVSTASVARELGYTGGHLTTVMRERTGRTVLDWLTERRMAEARRLLAETDLPLAAIAARTGFRDAAYLARRFGAWHGTTPQRWRRDARA